MYDSSSTGTIEIKIVRRIEVDVKINLPQWGKKSKTEMTAGY